MSAVDVAKANVAEIAEIVDALDSAALDAFVAALRDAPRLHCTGIGRSGLSTRAIAMRLMHIGKEAFVVGEVATPGIREGDLLVAVSSSGRGSILRQAQAARERGARVVAVTTRPNELTELAEVSLLLPARAEVETRQHAGSLFEQAWLVVGDAVCAAVQADLGVPKEDLDRRHANLQ
ncbi:SIS domain-containing protein [Sphaerisporangium sp. NPDC051011]|uniref:SIS domain-containing protein n=1 Tax=Sphaerisporangium sp. NPDC051011 TaxID=3155792 RepID=UPI0033CEF7D6